MLADRLPNVVDHQRRRRRARASDPGAPRRLHHPRAPRPAGRRERLDHRRHRALARGALEHPPADEDEGERHRGRAADADPGRDREDGRARRALARRSDRRRGRDHDAAHPARAAGEAALPVAARVLQHLRPDAGAAGAREQEGAIVMHPGPMNRGVEIASRRRRRSEAVGDSRAGHERRGGAHGGAVSARRSASVSEASVQMQCERQICIPHLHSRQIIMNLLITNARVIDPSQELDAKLDVLIEDGVDRARRQAHQGRTSRPSTPTGLIAVARLHRPAHASSRAGAGAQGDDRHRHARGGGGRLHGRLRDGQHAAAERRARGDGDDHRRVAAQRRVPRLSDRRGEQGTEGRGAGGAGRPARRRLRRRERRRQAGLERAADAPRARVLLDARHPGHRPRGGCEPHRRRRDARGLLLHAPRHGRNPGGVGGDARGARRDPGAR